LSEFALHVRAILGLPIPALTLLAPSASVAILAKGKGIPQFGNVAEALAEPDTALRLFGKPYVDGSRRVAVTLARDLTIESARQKARRAASALKVDLI
jgi:phosphoribosylglycinamide formyltransferase 2